MREETLNKFRKKEKIELKHSNEINNPQGTNT